MRYTVEVRGIAREVYTVEAEDPEDARARWHEGEHELTEVTDCEPVYVDPRPVDA